MIRWIIKIILFPISLLLSILTAFSDILTWHWNGVTLYHNDNLCICSIWFILYATQSKSSNRSTYHWISTKSVRITNGRGGYHWINRYSE